MKNSLLILCVLLLSATASAQQDGQDFCSGSEGSYFPLDIKKKKLVWSGTGYTETKTGTKMIAGKKFIEYSQKWANGSTDKLYMREENGIV
jgi:hypothetical protein